MCGISRLAANALFAVSLAGLSTAAMAVDDWDVGAIKDNTAATTRNELARGEWQMHDLEAIGGVADEDWYDVPTTSFRTYQVAIGQVTGDAPIDNADFLTLWDAAGTTLLATANAAAGATSKVIRFDSQAGTSFRVRVKGSVGSTATARYAINVVESTMYCPRYNNSGTQSSVVIIQNTTNGPCSVGISFIIEDGTSSQFTAGTVPSAGTLVVAGGSVAGVPGTTGRVQILPNLPNRCSPSALKAKVVALEPSTGFSFDTLCERR